MNEATGKVIEAIANDVLALSHLILEDESISKNKKVNKNTLRDSQLNKDLAISTSYTSEDILIKAIFNNYVGFIEWDRPKEYGDKPPIDSLRDWALSRNIPTDNSTLWAISTAIWKDGHEGRPILETLEKEIEESFDTEMYDKLFESIIDEITKYFN